MGVRVGLGQSRSVPILLIPNPPGSWSSSLRLLGRGALHEARALITLGADAVDRVDLLTLLEGGVVSNCPAIFWGGDSMNVCLM